MSDKIFDGQTFILLASGTLTPQLVPTISRHLKELGATVIEKSTFPDSGVVVVITGTKPGTANQEDISLRQKFPVILERAKGKNVPVVSSQVVAVFKKAKITSSSPIPFNQLVLTPDYERYVIHRNTSEMIAAEQELKREENEFATQKYLQSINPKQSSPVSNLPRNQQPQVAIKQQPRPQQTSTSPQSQALTDYSSLWDVNVTLPHAFSQFINFIADKTAPFVQTPHHFGPNLDPHITTTAIAGVSNEDIRLNPLHQHYRDNALNNCNYSDQSAIIICEST